MTGLMPSLPCWTMFPPVYSASKAPMSNSPTAQLHSTLLFILARFKGVVQNSIEKVATLDKTPTRHRRYRAVYLQPDTGTFAFGHLVPKSPNSAYRLSSSIREVLTAPESGGDAAQGVDWCRYRESALGDRRS